MLVACIDLVQLREPNKALVARIRALEQLQPKLLLDPYSKFKDLRKKIYSNKASIWTHILDVLPNFSFRSSGPYPLQTDAAPSVRLIPSLPHPT